MHISHSKSFNVPVSIAHATLAHMINVYEICLNTTKYPIFNVQDFRYCLWTSMNYIGCVFALHPTLYNVKLSVTLLLVISQKHAY